MNDIKELFMTTGITDSDRTLHTPGSFARKNLLYVQEVGQLKSLKPHKSQRENLTSFLFLLVIGGEGLITVGNKEYKVSKGNVAFINCEENYTHESSINHPWELMWVHFNGNTASEYYKLFLEQNDNSNIFAAGNTMAVQEIINDLMRHQKQKDLESELLSGELLLRLMNFCLIAVLHKDRESHERVRMLCNEIREYVNGHYQEESLLAFLADKAGAAEDELDDDFKRVYGISLRDYILNRRFTVAKELLRFTIKPVKEIIEESGIKNEDLFRRLFQDGEGMPAEEYRMKWSQWVK